MNLSRWTVWVWVGISCLLAVGCAVFPFSTAFVLISLGILLAGVVWSAFAASAGTGGVSLQKLPELVGNGGRTAADIWQEAEDFWKRYPQSTCVRITSECEVEIRGQAVIEPEGKAPEPVCGNSVRRTLTSATISLTKGEVVVTAPTGGNLQVITRTKQTVGSVSCPAGGVVEFNVDGTVSVRRAGDYEVTALESVRFYKGGKLKAADCKEVSVAEDGEALTQRCGKVFFNDNAKGIALSCADVYTSGSAVVYTEQCDSVFAQHNSVIRTRQCRKVSTSGQNVIWEKV